MVTIKALQAAKAGVWISDGGARGAGTLLFRRTASGAMLAYFRYTLPGGKRDTLPVGQYDEQGRYGMTLTEVRKRVGELSRLYQSGTKDIRTHLQDQQLAQEKARQDELEALANAEREAEERQRYTLRSLCQSYADALEGSGKTSSARHVRSIFKCHLFEPNPALAETSAREITSKQAAAVIRRVREMGKERTAGLLRAFLIAAYNAAKRAPFDSSLPSTLIPFDIQHNPVDAIPAIPVRAGNRILTHDELRAYLNALGNSVVDQALRLALLAGGQRLAQLLRATVEDYDKQARTLRLWDGKGKRIEPREHLLPLGDDGAALASELVDRANHLESPWIFSAYGKVRVTDSTPGKRVAEIAAAMSGKPFNLRDLRRTAETMLAGLGISRDTRAQLLSHGLTGVQHKHYDRYSYLDEKRAALIAWEACLAAIADHGTACVNGIGSLRGDGAA